MILLPWLISKFLLETLLCIFRAVFFRSSVHLLTFYVDAVDCYNTALLPSPSLHFIQPTTALFVPICKLFFLLLFHLLLPPTDGFHFPCL
jgi:hypothetical protein